MAQWSRAFAALEDDYSLLPRLASQFCNSSSRKVTPWSGSGGYQACTCCPYTQADETPAENINKQKQIAFQSIPIILKYHHQKKLTYISDLSM